MTKQFSRLIAWGCYLMILLTPIFSIYLLWDIDLFSTQLSHYIHLPIHWHTVTIWQWYFQWLMTAAYISIGLIGLYFLHCAFRNFANGELFNLVNSHYIRMFSIFLFAQALAKPLYFTLSSVLLSLNHPDGEKIFSISVGSNEIIGIALGMILWVMSDLLVIASNLKTETEQYI